MNKSIILLMVLTIYVKTNYSNDVLGCGGFVKSHVQIDFAKVEVKLLTKQGILKDKTTCAPNNGYYFLPIYDKGDYTLELNPPPGWSFNPRKVELTIDRLNDLCTKGVDINFNFKGFGIAGKVESFGDFASGPEGVLVELKYDKETRSTVTSVGGTFSFTPVYPGLYKIQIQHARWKLLKNELEVKVTEGNTELPQGSLIVHGYSISGYARSQGEAVSNTTILLFSEIIPNNNNVVLGCDKSPVLGFTQSKKPLCQAKTDSNGRFSFPSVAVGKYYVAPFYINQNMDVEPTKIEFSVRHADIELQKTFEVIGFSVTGRIVRSVDANKPGGLPNVKIHLNGRLITKTDSQGFYKLEKLKTGMFKLKPEADNVVFEELTLKISPNMQYLPDLEPSAFKLSGKVDSDQSQSVTIVKVGSTFMKNVQTDPATGKFSEYLPKGTYEVQVEIKQSGKGKGLQFYPIVQKVEVFSEDNNIVLFSQLKATVVGKVQCLHEDNCRNLEVLLQSVHRPNDKAMTTALKGQGYQFIEVFPGLYKLSLSSNRFCWVKDTHEIVINSITVNAPVFVQNGYSANFISSHNTKVSYKLQGNSIKGDLEIEKGQSIHCLPEEGSYIFEYQGCHSYANTTFTFNTNAVPNEIKLDAVAHMNRICIASDANHGPLTASIDIDGEKMQKGPLPYENGCYIIELILEPGANAIILPQSEIYYFKPPIFSIKGKQDCTQFGQAFKAIKGHVYKGKIVPALPGTLITLEDDKGKIWTTETDGSGYYKFPPMDQSRKYKITAKKESYQLVGPSENGDFTTYKLAQVVVEVLDEKHKSPLQGTLLSLSGGLSYRSNLQTDDNGKIAFHSLNPSEYYLKPMMKEYKFEPSSMIIHVKEGETIDIKLIGKRIAYSAFGSVTSLNNIPEHNSIVEAVGIGNCSHLSEETTIESNGKFRVRGLQPNCTYHLRAKDSSVEQCIPEFIEIKDIRNDIQDLHLILLRPKKQIKVLVNIFSEVPEYSKMLTLNVYLRGPPLSLVHNIKLDTARISKESNPGIMVYLPPLPMDGKTYVLQLESPSTQNLKWATKSSSIVANSTFKFAQLEFSVKSNVTEQQIKQTSIWSFFFIIVCLVGAYNIDIVLKFLNDRFNINLSSFGFLKNKVLTPSEYPLNESDIDQIVQSINYVKRKTKRNS